MEPGARVARLAARPGDDRGGERLLQRLLGDVEVAEGLDERREQVAPLRAAQAIEVGKLNFWMGRTSTEPWRAAGILAAMPMASSRSFASTR